MAEDRGLFQSGNATVRAAIRVAGVFLAVAVLVLFVWYQRQLLLLAFAGILVAIFLRTITKWIERITHLSPMFSYMTTLLLLGGAAAGLGMWLVPRFSTQLSEVMASLPKSIHQIEQPLLQKSWGRDLIGEVHKVMQSAGEGSQVPQIAHAVIEGVVDLVLIAAIGFFAGLNPRGYREGTLILLPESRRQKLREMVVTLREQLKWWLFGQMFVMLSLGVACGVGLWLLGVPLAWSLGLITGIAVFVPYVGTITAGVPSVLMGLQKGPHTALWVLIFYTGLHLVEGYLLTPFIQRRAVRLPPVLTILSQFLMWNVAGILGVALAAPLTTAGLVLIKQAYLHVPPQEDVVKPM